MAASVALKKKGNQYIKQINETSSPSGGIVKMAAYTTLTNKKNRSQKDNQIYLLEDIAAMGTASELM